MLASLAMTKPSQINKKIKQKKKGKIGENPQKHCKHLPGKWKWWRHKRLSSTKVSKYFFFLVKIDEFNKSGKHFEAVLSKNFAKNPSEMARKALQEA